MKLIIGLGNPEKNYRNTRHNVGFETVNKISFDHKIEINKAKNRAHIGQGRITGEQLMLVKPQTYMNNSGECVREMLRYYRLDASDIVVIYDDTDISPGQVRIRERGSAGGHNGIASIIYQLNTDEFIRIRIGIGPKPPGMELADYVLSKIKQHEISDIVTGITKAAEAVELILKESAAAAMNRYNIKEAVIEPTV